METLKLKVTLRQFSLETRHTFTKNFYIASETFKLWPCFCWGQNGDLKKGCCTGNWKAYFISHGVPKCAIFDAARSHLHIWLMENGSFLDVFMVIYLLIIVFSIATLNTHIVCTCVSCCMIAT